MLRLETDCMHSVEIGIGLFAVAATQIDMYNVVTTIGKRLILSIQAEQASH